MTKIFDDLPYITRLLLLFFFGWIIGGVYRVVKWTENKNTTTLVVGLLGLFTGVGNFILEIVDFVTTALGNGISVYAD
jgi:hypothetical protein